MASTITANSNSIVENLEIGKHYDIEFGETWNSTNDTNTSKYSYHTINYDFKPASVMKSDQAELKVGPNQDVSITIPNIEGSSTQSTKFCGSTKPYTVKECLMIIDPKSGKIVLERLSANVRVKNVRSSNSSVKPMVTRLNQGELPVEKKAVKTVTTTLNPQNKPTPPVSTAAISTQKATLNNPKSNVTTVPKTLTQRKNSPSTDDRLSDDESLPDLTSDNSMNSMGATSNSLVVNKVTGTGFEILEHDLQLSDTTDDEA